MNLMRFATVSLLVLLFLITSPAHSAEPRLLAQAHAHNDYEHARPLFDALARGFSSVEADIHLVDGQLLVGHDPPDLKPERTLEKLYLEPLRKRIAANDGWVYSEAHPVILLIDIKTAGQPTYALLAKKLTKYRDLTRPHKTSGQAPVRLIISGNRAFDAIARDADRQVGIDGRIPDLDGELPSELMPLVSDNWRNHFRWRGEGEMPNEEREKLSNIVERAHEQGRLLRFWATPENERLWRVLAEHDVDLIGTDDLARLQKFLLSRDP